jgi:hypothetical protein
LLDGPRLAWTSAKPGNSRGPDIGPLGASEIAGGAQVVASVVPMDGDQLGHGDLGETLIEICAV